MPLHFIRLISSFSDFLSSSCLVKSFRLTVPPAVLGHLGAISLKNLTKLDEVKTLEMELIRLGEVVKDHANYYVNNIHTCSYTYLYVYN